MSTSPAATSAPEPVEEPPGVWPQARGFWTGPEVLVAAPPEKRKIFANRLADDLRAGIEEARDDSRIEFGTKPSSTDDPLVRGTPAIA